MPQNLDARKQNLLDNLMLKMKTDHGSFPLLFDRVIL